MDIQEALDEIQSLSAMCNVMACALDECEVSQFTCVEMSGCFHHISTSLDCILQNLIKSMHQIKE